MAMTAINSHIDHCPLNSMMVWACVPTPVELVVGAVFSAVQLQVGEDAPSPEGKGHTGAAQVIEEILVVELPVDGVVDLLVEDQERPIPEQHQSLELRRQGDGVVAHR